MSTTLAIQEHRPTPSGVPAVREAMEQLKSIRTFVAEELTPGVDYGTIPGTGTKQVMLLPGAQKVAMFLNVYPQYRVRATELGNGHVEYLVKTELVSRSTGARVGSGIGSCSTMEGKYRHRTAGRSCPDCGKATIIQTKKGRNPGGYWCVPDKGGCGANYNAGDPAVEGQKSGKVENDNIYDQRNTVLKMAKKRSLVDASIGLACLSDQFTQDIDDTYDLSAAPAPAPSPAPAKDAGRDQVNAQFPPAAEAPRPAVPHERTHAPSPAPSPGPREPATGDEDTVFQAFLQEVLDEWHGFEAIQGDKDRQAREHRVVHDLVSRGLVPDDEGQVRLNPRSILKPAAAGKEAVRDPVKVWGAARYLVTHHRAWARNAAGDHLNSVFDRLHPKG